MSVLINGPPWWQTVSIFSGFKNWESAEHRDQTRSRRWRSKETPTTTASSRATPWMAMSTPPNLTEQCGSWNVHPSFLAPSMPLPPTLPAPSLRSSSPSTPSTPTTTILLPRCVRPTLHLLRSLPVPSKLCAVFSCMPLKSDFNVVALFIPHFISLTAFALNFFGWVLFEIGMHVFLIRFSIKSCVVLYRWFGFTVKWFLLIDTSEDISMWQVLSVALVCVIVCCCNLQLANKTVRLNVIEDWFLFLKLNHSYFSILPCLIFLFKC